MRGCIVEGCPQKHYGHGLCQMHYEATPTHKAAKAAYDATPARRAAWAAYKKTPAYKKAARVRYGRAWMGQGRRRVDEVVVDRLIHGERVDSSVKERIEATRQLTHWGHTRPFIAAQMRVTQRSVGRYQHELLLQEGVQL